jgi:hypothetical protein
VLNILEYKISINSVELTYSKRQRRACENIVINFLIPYTAGNFMIQSILQGRFYECIAELETSLLCK